MADDGPDLVGEEHRGLADNVAFVEDLGVVVDETLQLQIRLNDHLHFQLSLIVLGRNLRRSSVGLISKGTRNWVAVLFISQVIRMVSSGGPFVVTLSKWGGLWQ